MNINDFSDWIHRINGQTIAVVYIFEGENIEGFKHYDIWKSDVISEYLVAYKNKGFTIPFTFKRQNRSPAVI